MCGRPLFYHPIQLQQIRGNCSPLNMSSTRRPPIRLSSVTMLAVSEPCPQGCGCFQVSAPT